MPNMYGNRVSSQSDDPYAVSRQHMIMRTRQEFTDPMSGQVDEEGFREKVFGNMYNKGDTIGIEKLSKAMQAQGMMREKQREFAEKREAPVDVARVYEAVMANKKNLGTSMDPDTFAVLNAAAANPQTMKVMKDIKDTKGEKKPKTLTLSQQARNDEIDAARAEFSNMGLTKEEVQKRTKQYGATGRTNPDYDPVVGKIYNKAITRKVGDDPDYRDFYNSFVGAGKAEKAAQPKLMDALPDASKHKGKVIYELDAQGNKTGKKLKSDGKSWIKAQAGGNINLAMNAEDVPLGNGMADQSKSLIQLRNELTRAYMNGDDNRAAEIERQIQQIAKQPANVG